MEAPLCALGILDDLKKKIDSEQWHNRETQKATYNGVEFAKQELMKNGFIPFNPNEELNLTPLNDQNSSN